VTFVGEKRNADNIFIKERGHLEGVDVARKIILKKGLLRNFIRGWGLDLSAKDRDKFWVFVTSAMNI